MQFIDICHDLTLYSPHTIYPMARILFITLIAVVFSIPSKAEPYRQKRSHYDYYGKRLYRISLHLSNPLGLGSKMGGGLEIRSRRTSYVATYTNYVGGYTGKQYAFEYDFFIPSTSKKETFVYLKGVIGDATFDNKKLSLFGQTDEIMVGPRTYSGGGIGFGKRYHKKVFFFDWRLGLKYCVLDDPAAGSDDVISKASKDMFRLFYVTGPGAFIDCHFGFGLQL